MNWPNTYGADRQYFQSSLITRPLFLLQHAPFLFGAVFKRLRTRLRLLASGDPVHGAKRWPRWLRYEEADCRPIAISQLLERLPSYPPATLEAGVEYPGSNAVRTMTSRDPEDYLADHRWAHLPFFSSDNYERRLAIDYIAEWIECNNDTSDAAWETYSVCERVANSLIFFAMRPANTEAPQIPEAYIEFLCRSVVWIYKHLEYYGDQNTNNHILNNARTLVMSGVVLRAPVVLNAGLRIFRRSLPRLVTTDGYLREQSTHYQLVVLNWVADAWKFLRSVDKPDSETVAFLEQYLRNMSVAAAMFMDGQGDLCGTIGDVSPDLTPRQAIQKLSNLYPEIWQNRPKLFSMCEVASGWFRLSTADSVALGNFAEGAFPLPYPTHGHNDLTGFIWTKGGSSVLTDLGRSRYTSDDLSLMQKSAAGHNVPVINGFAPLCETLLPNGRLWPIPYARATAVKNVEKNIITLSHDGFSRATPVKRHTRKLRLDEDVLEVVDVFDGNGEVMVDFCWHFGSAYSRFDEEGLVFTGTANMVKIELLHPITLDRIAHRRCTVAELHESPRYGASVPSIGVRIEVNAVLPAKIMTRFTVLPCAV